MLPGFNKPINEHVEAYLKVFTEERGRLKGLCTLIKETKDEDSLFDRKNEIGHITASGLVLSPDRKSILLFRHKVLDRLLQPGGHVDPSDATVFAAACREVTEETGIRKLQHLPYHVDYYLPIDIDTHDILANPKLCEGRHLHHDFRYLFYVDSEEEIKGDRLRNDGDLVWRPLENVAMDETFRTVVEKIRIALSHEFLPRRFYQKLVEIAQYPRRFSSVVVTHILPDSRSYLEALSSVSEIRSIIPKPKSIVPDILDGLKTQFTVGNLDRQDVAEGDKLYRILDPIDSDFILFDIGGYFAPIANILALRYEGKIRGIIEDTENGHQKYEEVHCKSPLALPVVSVARSPLKETEDFLVGQSVLFSADAILRDCGKLLQYLSCSVLGYGKIGRSIAHHLLLRGIKPSVYDTNSIRRIFAQNQLCDTPEMRDILQQTDVLFSATGSHSLGTPQFRLLKSGCFVFSVTSSEDEFDTKFLLGEYESDKIAPHVFRYSRKGHYFYLINQGNAVNFIHKAVLGSFIHLVRSEMIYAGACLMRNEIKVGLHELSKTQRLQIADTWLSVFNTEKKTNSRFEIKDKLV